MAFVIKSLQHQHDVASELADREIIRPLGCDDAINASLDW